MVPTLDEEVALMATELRNRIYKEAGLEIETIRYYELQFHVLQANLPEKLRYIFQAQLAEWTMTRSPWKSDEATVWACPCLFMKLLRLGRILQNFAEFHYQAHAFITMKLRQEFNARQAGLGNNYHSMYASCQARAAGLAYTIVNAVIKDKKDAEPNYTNVQVRKKETDNTDPGIRFWDIIDRKKEMEILEVEKGLKTKEKRRKGDREESERPQQEEGESKEREKLRERRHEEVSYWQVPPCHHPCNFN
uniref:Uncharacterized protein n=1 Tax=Romanomermis culicivorax TaxID=13658 RepID=A0A915KT36_ROMCU